MSKFDANRSSSMGGQNYRVVNYPYAAVARATQEHIAWAHITTDPQWKWLENVGEFAVYALEDDNGGGARGFRALATGIVQGSVYEIAALLTATSQHDFYQKMAALNGKDFKHATHIASVDKDAQTASQEGKTIANATGLSIRSATFAAPNILRRDEEWCFLDATAFDRKRVVFEKLMTSLKIQDILTAGDIRTVGLGSSKSLQDIVCGFRVFAEDGTGPGIVRDGKSHGGAFARVEFYAEYRPSVTQQAGAFDRFGSFSKQDAAMKVAQQRLLSIARNCDRLPLLVRRRRLGVQVLMDKRYVLSLSNRKCISCTKSQRLAKLCRVCGNAVCGDCSQKYERDACLPHTNFMRVESVRVCDPCMIQIEGGDFDMINDRSLFGPTVFPERKGQRKTGKNLKTLLQEALLTASTPKRKNALISVIRSVLEQEEGGRKAARPRFESATSTATSVSSEQDYIAALDQFTVPHVPYADAEVAGQQGRSYALDPINLQATYPVPHNEPDRLRAINDLGVLEKAANWAELDIICDLFAKEIGASASIVSVVTENESRVVAANLPDFLQAHSARDNAFCAHTIMEDRPLIVPHPEADFRMSHIQRKWNMGVRFYCGFPLKADDDTIIGTLCCVDQQSHELTESQYSAMARLAQTATKIIRVEAKNKRRTTVA
jgi:hypothetical protein